MNEALENLEVSTEELKTDLLWLIENRKNRGSVCPTIPDWDELKVIVQNMRSFPFIDRERHVLHALAQNRSYSEVGSLFNVTRERIRQIEWKCLRKLYRGGRFKYRGCVIEVGRSREGFDAWHNGVPYCEATGDTVGEVLSKVKRKIRKYLRDVEEGRCT